MSRTASLWKAMAGQWPILGVDPLSAGRLRKRADTVRLPVLRIVAVDWLSSLILFLTPFIAHLTLGGGEISVRQFFLLIAIGGLLFVALQRPLRFLALLALGADPGVLPPC